MPAPVRYPNGVTNRPPRHVMASLPVLDPTRYVTFFDDFTSFTVAASGVSGWHLDEVNAGSSPVVQDAHGGIIKLVLANADNDNQHHQWATNTDEHGLFALAVGKKAWLRVRFKVEDADKDLPMIGLHTIGDDPWGTEPADQFLFRTLRADPDALQFAVGTTNSTEQTISLGDLADDTWVICTAYWDGIGKVFAWRESSDGVVTHSGFVSVSADTLPDGVMTPAFGMEATDTGADDMHIDYIYVIAER